MVEAAREKPGILGTGAGGLDPSLVSIDISREVGCVRGSWAKMAGSTNVIVAYR